jgi:DNA-binding MarR family transcriptional regulator
MSASNSNKLTMISLEVFRLNGLLLEWGNHFSSKHGLTSARWQIMGAVTMADHPPSIPQIAEAMGVTRQGVLKQINLLVEEGLVASIANPAHKRSPNYVLTECGTTLYEAVRARWQAHVEDLAPSFSQRDLDGALRVLALLSSKHRAAVE